MTAVLDETPQISKPAKAVVFSARREDLRLVKVPRYPVLGQSGQKVGEHPGEAIQFRRGLLEVPTDGTLALEDGREVDGAEIAEWLQRHKLFGNRDEGFFKVEIAAPAPGEDEMNALVMAAVGLDEDRLEEIVREEEAGWGREAILKVAREGVERIREFKAQNAAPEPEPVKAKPGPKPKAESE